MADDNKEDADPEPVPQMTALTEPAQILDYIRNITEELSGLCRKAGLNELAHILSLAAFLAQRRQEAGMAD